MAERGGDAAPGRWWAFTDGASRGNPGPAGAGWVLGRAGGPATDGGERYLGRRTNNEAEYMAAILAVRAAAAHGARELTLFADSQLMVRQLEGAYQVRHPNIRPLFAELRAAAAQAGIALVARHVPREENRAADARANAAIDQAAARLASPGGLAVGTAPGGSGPGDRRRGPS